MYLRSFAFKTTLNWWIFALAGLMALGIAIANSELAELADGNKESR